MLKLVAVCLLVISVIAASTWMHANAATYEKQADFQYVKERIVKPYPGKSGWWIYHLWVCADDYSLGIAEVVLSSDTETLYQGVNKAIQKGKCSTYGAVMKAKNPNTLGYKITTISEAAEKIVASKQGKLGGTNWSEIGRYKFILGFY
ncbi:MAG: hypothetical protein QXN55_05330 [Candidatus Nitrosotenuis sp.]